MSSDNDCVCRGNWRLILKKVGHLIGETYVDNRGDEHTFFGLVHGSDDYYYGMWHKASGKASLISCVGDIESFGFTLVPATAGGARA